MFARIIISIACCAALALGTSARAGSWTKLTNKPSVNSIQIMILMSDGSLMMQTFDDIQTWVKLTPDAKGSYINGTWTTLGKMITPRLYFASQVMRNGKLWVMGGEYTGPFEDANWGSQAEIYDPLTNTWSEAASFPPQQGCGTIPITSNVSLIKGSPVVKGIYSTFRILPGWSVAGPGIPANSTVLKVDSPTRVTISGDATASGPATVQFSGVPTSCFGDDPSILVRGHNILVGDLVGPKTYLYSIPDNVFTETGTKVYDDSSDEEGWAVLPNAHVLDYDLFESIEKNMGYAETYIPSLGLWISISPADGTAKGTLPVLSSPAVGYELGPIIRVLDGRIVVIGANQHTALYTPSTNTWQPGPDMLADLTGPGGTIPDARFGADDAPAAILPNGHVFLVADAGPNPVSLDGSTKAGSSSIELPSTAGLQPGWSVAQTDGKNTVIPQGAVIYSVDSADSITLGAYNSSGNLVPIDALNTNPDVALVLGGIFSPPAQLFDFDAKAGTMTPIPPPPGSFLPYEGAYVTRMLILPTGQLMLSDSSNQLYVYTPEGCPPESLRPVITDVDFDGNGTFTLTGRMLNGQSAGAAYGDDDQMDENRPIVRLEDRHNGNVYYCRTTDWSSVAVDGEKRERVKFTLNPAVKPGKYDLVVVGAGIASHPHEIRIREDELRCGEDANSINLPGASNDESTPHVGGNRLPPPIHRHQ